nr:immunoglobulin heavy chain junction region [Mus musculus]
CTRSDYGSSSNWYFDVW